MRERDVRVRGELTGSFPSSLLFRSCFHSLSAIQFTQSDGLGGGVWLSVCCLSVCVQRGSNSEQRVGVWLSVLFVTHAFSASSQQTTPN